MAFGTSSILPYLAQMETKTLETLLENLTTGTFGIAGGTCLYGRNPGTPGQCSVDWRPDQMAPQVGETYSCAGYGSPQALYTMARRQTGQLKEDALQWLARWSKHFFDVTLVSMTRNGHDHPPGEDTIHGPCYPTNPPGHRSDSDPPRHIDAFGHLQILADANMKARGGWSSAYAVNAAGLYYKWLRDDFSRERASNVREFIRYGNRLNGFAGLYDVAKFYGYDTLAEDIIADAAAYVLWIYRDDWKYEYTGTDGTTTFHIWNYGPIRDNGMRQFNGLGDTEWTSQPWYDFHQVIGAYNLFRRMLKHWTDAESLSDFSLGTGTDYTSLYRLAEFVEAQTKWYSYDHRAVAPRGDYSTNDGDGFVNAKSHGLKFGTATNNYIESATDAGLMTVADWESLSDNAQYYRSHGIRAHESDGGYQVVYYTHTFTNTRRAREHHPRKGIPWQPNLTTGTSLLEPQFAQNGANAHGIPDMLFIRSLLTGGQDAQDFALISAFDQLAFAHKSDALVRKGDRLKTSLGWSPPANLMNYGRPWHWTVQVGTILRDELLGIGDTE